MMRYLYFTLCQLPKGLLLRFFVLFGFWGGGGVSVGVCWAVYGGGTFVSVALRFELRKLIKIVHETEGCGRL